MSVPLAELDRQAEIVVIIHNIVYSQLGRSVLDVQLPSHSKGDATYVVVLQHATEEIPQFPKPGTDPLPEGKVSVIMRFVDVRATVNHDVMVQSQVAAMQLAREALTPTGRHLVPRVYGWGAAAAGRAGWVLEELMHGVPLAYNDFVNAPSEHHQRVILTEIAHMVQSFQAYRLPDSVKGYGGLDFSDDGDIVTGPTPFKAARRACHTYCDLYTEYLQTQLDSVERGEFAPSWRHEPCLMERVNAFVVDGFGPLLNRSAEAHPRPTLVHGNLDIHSLLIDPATFHVTALLNFDFSHVAARADEFFYSFTDIQSFLPPPTFVPGQKQLREHLLHGFPIIMREREDDGDVNWKIAKMADEIFSLVGVVRPVDLKPRMESLSELYWFIQHINPGVLFEPVVRDGMSHDLVNVLMDTMQKSLELTLSRWGY